MTTVDHRHPEPDEVAVKQLYDDFAAAQLMPLWTQREEMMGLTPEPGAVPTCWQWSTLLPLAERAGQLVPVGRGGERRAIALANPGIPGKPFATGTLWAAIQYLGPRESAPAHRHSQTAFRFVVDGEGVWTNVDGDAVAMRRGDLLLTPSWHFHEHHNPTDAPMAWLDGLDIPLVRMLDAGFFEPGSETLTTTATPASSVGERLWGHPGLLPLVAPRHRSSPLLAYRWAHTDAALDDQLACEAEGVSATVEPGHAAVRFTNPATGGDGLLTIRTEMHRLASGTTTVPVRVVGSSVWQVFDGRGTITVADRTFTVQRGDVVAVPSWQALTISAHTQLDLFRFGDDPLYEAVGLDRVARGTSTGGR